MAPLTTHGACGKSWTQRGNRTGHCSACHNTFEGATLFDNHQIINPDGSITCKEPATMQFHGYPLTLKEGSYRSGKPFDKGVFSDAD